MESSPSVLSPPAHNVYQTLDFLSLAGLDNSVHAELGTDSPGDTHSSTIYSGLGRPAAEGSATADNPPFDLSSTVEDDDVPLDDPSPISLEPHYSETPSSSQPTHNYNPMDVDSHAGQASSSGARGSNRMPMGPASGHSTPGLDASDMGGVYEMQAGLLRHQLEAIHMQSPYAAAANAQSPYNAMAQMFLTSPPDHAALPDAAIQSPVGPGGEPVRKFSAKGMFSGGVLTPGPSGEMLPEMRMDHMSPMQLELLGRAGEYEGMENFHAVPLLSPALSQHTSSNYASPVAQVAFSGSSQITGGGGPGNSQVLEQLQLQQRQFQEQLALLQEQQRQLQATAAAVVAAQSSPYLSPQHPQASQPYQQQQQQQQQQQHHQQQPRRALTPGNVSAGQSAGSMSTPSPSGYFSPLTSPALEPAVGRSAALRAAAQHLSSPAMHGQQRAPHPLSGVPSPALNPLGSSGGAQQTLSPALGPQTGADLTDPDYLNALQNILDGNGQAETAAYQSSPVIGPSSTQASPALGPSGPGPHRQGLHSKSRPSPMMKPVNHRSHARHSSNSVPTSPMSFKMTQAGQGYLPPTVIDQRGVLQQQQQYEAQQQAGSNSASSTPSPVDLAHIMPPPPLPTPNRAKPGVMPMTPATLMNLGKGDVNETGPSPQSGHDEQQQQQQQAETSPNAKRALSSTSSTPPVRSAAKRATANIAPAPAGGAPKRGSRLVPSGGAAATKRALAIRPSGGGAVGVRTATKGAASAAAAAANNAEPETRRTSHKAAEQKRRDSLKAGFDELRLLLPPINTEALDPESGEPIPGSSAPRLLPKSSLVPDDNPNRGVSKVALLKFSNEYIVRLHNKVEKRDGYIDKLRDEVRRLRGLGDPELAGEEIRGDEDEDLLDMDMLDGEEDDLGDEEEEAEMEIDQEVIAPSSKRSKGKPAATPKRPAQRNTGTKGRRSTGVTAE